MKNLTKAGHRKPTRKAAIITEDMEKVLWQKGILGNQGFFQFHSPTLGGHLFYMPPLP